MLPKPVLQEPDTVQQLMLPACSYAFVCSQRINSRDWHMTRAAWQLTQRNMWCGHIKRSALPRPAVGTWCKAALVAQPPEELLRFTQGILLLRMETAESNLAFTGCGRQKELSGMCGRVPIRPRSLPWLAGPPTRCKLPAPPCLAECWSSKSH